MSKHTKESWDKMKQDDQKLYEDMKSYKKETFKNHALGKPIYDDNGNLIARYIPNTKYTRIINKSRR